MVDSMRKHLILLIFIIPYLAIAQSWEEVYKLTASDRGLEDQFSSSISVYGNYAIVGALTEDEDDMGNNTFSNAGSAYIYEKGNDGSWTEKQKLVALDRDIEDQFGYAVAIYNNYAVVGAWAEDHDENGNNSMSLAGSAYIFKRNSSGKWNQIQKIVASDRFGADQFGSSVAIYGDYIVVGTYREDEDESGTNTLSEAGSIYIYQKQSNGNWVEVQKVTPSDRGAGDRFGWSLAISEEQIIVGAYREDEDLSGSNTMSNAGAAYIFEKNTNGLWVESQKIIASDRNSEDQFARSVDIDKNIVVVGALTDDEDETNSNFLNASGSAYIFEKNQSGNWIEVQKIVANDRSDNDFFGVGVAISHENILVGSMSRKNSNGVDSVYNAGAAYFFKKNNSGIWEEISKKVASDRDVEDLYGQNVALYNNTALISAKWEDEDYLGVNTLNRSGSAYLLDFSLYNQVSGYLYKDDSQNCLYNTTELGLPYIVKANQQYALANDSGKYDIFLKDSIQYLIQPLFFERFQNAINSVCPPNYSIFIDSTWSKDSSGFDFGFDIEPCPILKVEIASNRRRRCAKNSTYIKYCNEGFADEDSVVVKVQFPQYVEFISADHAFTIDQDSNYVFEIGNLSQGECGMIHIFDSVSCISGITGLVQCTKAWIIPENTCLEALDTITNWDKSSVKVEGSCINDSIVRFVIYNTGEQGNGDMQGTSEYRIYVDNTLSYTGTFQLLGEDSLVLEIEANGQTIRLEADQRPGHPGNSKPRETVEGCGNGGQPINFNMPLQVASNDEDITVEEHCLSIIDSYDPNDKNVQPSGIGSDKYVQPNTMLDYVIQFQNTGTDTAYNVVIIDTLDMNLDISTLQWGVSSHSYELTVTGTGNPVLTFTFENINLPDSTTDELNSQGFIKFKIKPYNTLSNGTVISNDADIYFDFNEPITTNDAWVTIFDTTIIGTPITVTVITPDTTTTPPENSVYYLKESDFNVLPNPFNEDVSLIFDIDIVQNELSVAIIDLLGKKIYDYEIFEAQSLYIIDGSSFEKGIYILQLVDKSSGVVVGRKKIIKQ